MKNPAPPEQIVSVCDEIQYILDSWPEGQLEEREIRAGSAIFRRLLVHSELNKVWNTLIGAQKFIIPTAVIEIDAPELLKFYDLYTCTEAKHKGATIYSVQAYTGKTTMTPLGDGQFRDDTERGVHIETKKLSLSQYMDSNCIIAGGKIISRNWVVQYVANTLGGAHFGAKSKKKPGFDGAMAKLKQFDVGQMPVSVRELLGIGQAICRAESTKVLMSAYSGWRKKNPDIRIA